VALWVEVSTDTTLIFVGESNLLHFVVVVAVVSVPQLPVGVLLGVQVAPELLLHCKLLLGVVLETEVLVALLVRHHGELVVSEFVLRVVRVAFLNHLIGVLPQVLPLGKVVLVPELEAVGGREGKEESLVGHGEGSRPARGSFLRVLERVLEGIRDPK